MTTRYSIKNDYNKIIYSDRPPIITNPIPATLRKCFTNANDLQLGLAQENEKLEFPFQRELMVYLLLVSSLWPNAQDRLLTAARIFSAALNFHINRGSFRRARRTELRRYFAESKVQLFNKRLFKSIGGQESMLFCQSSQDFHADIWRRIADLTMIHDVIDYILKTSYLSKAISSSEFAFHAIANNIFEREGGYGIAAGKKRNARPSGMVTTPNSVREKWRKMNDMTILSYFMLRWVGVHYRDPGDPAFIATLHDVSENLMGKNFRKFYDAIQSVLQATANPFSSLKGRTRITTAVPSFRLGGLLMLTEEELERALELSDSFFTAMRRLSDEDKDAVRGRRRQGGLHKPSF